MGLFKPAWLSNNLEKALMAVEKENDQAQLTEIAKSALTFEVRLKAVEKMTSQKELACIVQEPCPAYAIIGQN